MESLIIPKLIGYLPNYKKDQILLLIKLLLVLDKVTTLCPFLIYIRRKF